MVGPISGQTMTNPCCLKIEYPPVPTILWSITALCLPFWGSHGYPTIFGQAKMDGNDMEKFVSTCFSCPIYHIWDTRVALGQALNLDCSGEACRGQCLVSVV